MILRRHSPGCVLGCEQAEAFDGAELSDGRGASLTGKLDMALKCLQVHACKTAKRRRKSVDEARHECVSRAGGVDHVNLRWAGHGRHPMSDAKYAPSSPAVTTARRHPILCM